MTNLIFHSQNFIFKGIPIPEFNIIEGRLVRLCLPNFDSVGNGMVIEFRFELLNHFEKIIPKLKWSKEYSENRIIRLLKPISVGKYISRELNIDKEKAETLANYLELDINEKVKKLRIGKSKALALVCDFQKYDLLIYDYYGLGADEFEYLEKIIITELAKGKSAIALDRLEFQIKEEIYKNVDRVKITVGNN
jgi:hypothetical protein